MKQEEVIDLIKWELSELTKLRHELVMDGRSCYEEGQRIDALRKQLDELKGTGEK